MSTSMLKTTKNCYLTIASFVFLLGSILAYVYFLNTSITSVVLRQEALASATELRSQIAALEAKYIMAQHNISAKVASADNFNNQSEKIFLSRASSALVLNTEN